MDNFIGISNDRQKHILGVARKCYSISKNMGFDEEFSRKMFIIGYLHDIGYEFSNKQEEHPDFSVNLLILLGDIDYKIIEAIKYHGKPLYKENIYWKILNTADMTISPSGKEIDVNERLQDIKNRYGENSNQYLTAYDICYQLNLIHE